MSSSQVVFMVATGESSELDVLLRHDTEISGALLDAPRPPQAMLDAADERHRNGDYGIDHALRALVHPRLRAIDAKLTRGEQSVSIEWSVRGGYGNYEFDRDAVAAAYPLLDFDVDIVLDPHERMMARYRRGLFCGKYVLSSGDFDADQAHVEVLIESSSEAAAGVFIQAARKLVDITELPLEAVGLPRFRMLGANVEALRLVAEHHPGIQVTVRPPTLVAVG
jgi:hypothetical protein